MLYPSNPLTGIHLHYFTFLLARSILQYHLFCPGKFMGVLGPPNLI